MKYTKEKLYHNLCHDWDGELNALASADLWDTPNSNSRHVRRMVVEECLAIVRDIKHLPWWERLFNMF